MSNLRRVLERQEREDEEIRLRRAKEDHELDEEEDEVIFSGGYAQSIKETPPWSCPECGQT
ncbi:unnamed protein product [Prunus armeniaca]